MEVANGKGAVVAPDRLETARLLVSSVSNDFFLRGISYPDFLFSYFAMVRAGSQRGRLTKGVTSQDKNGLFSAVGTFFGGG